MFKSLGKFLERLKQRRQTVSVFSKSGRLYEGEIQFFDDETIIVRIKNPSIDGDFTKVIYEDIAIFMDCIESIGEKKI